MTIWKLLDKLEDKIRGWFSRHPLLYSLYGGVGIVLFWRGVWHGMDAIAEHFIVTSTEITSMDFLISFKDAGISLALGSLILLSCGLFVSELIGKEIIISGLRGEKRLTERTETEVRTETGALAEVLRRLDELTEQIGGLPQKK